MRRIGILTFHFAHNYGAMLQAYALKHYISETGHPCEIINYVPTKMSEAYSERVMINGKFSLKRIFSLIKRKKQISLFNHFMEYKLEVKENDISDFEIIIVGSDQVWNTQLTLNDGNYFLDSISDDVIGIGYGISVGKQELNEDTLALIQKGVCHFKNLSFREELTCNQVEKLLQREFPNVVDPVFLFNGRDWEQIAKKPEKIKKDRFILYYTLNYDKKLVDEAIRLSEKKGLPIYFVHPLCVEPHFKVNCLRDVGPEEFLWLIKNAQYVVTNSFHATAFSIIFEKKCVVAHNGQLGERTRHLYSLVDVNKNQEGIIDFSCVNKERLVKQIDISKEYIEDNLRI